MVDKVIFDTDPGVDDVLALLLLLASPEVILEGITVTFGNTTLDHATDNVLKVYQLIDTHIRRHPNDAARFPYLNTSPKTMLAKGSKGPLEGDLDLAEYFHGPDGLSDISNTHREFDLESSINPTSIHPYLDIRAEPAWDIILSILAREPSGTVTLFAAGPLTNVARAFQTDPKTFTRVKRVVSMGGALDVPGNTSASAEFNFFADPFAANIMLKAATRREFNFVLLPLDITSQHTIPFSALIPSIPTDEHVLHAFLTAILARPRLVLKSLGLHADVFEMHDPLAAWFVIRHASAGIEGENGIKGDWETTKRRFVIERKGEWTKGMCIVDRRGTLEVPGAVRSKDGIDIMPDETEARIVPIPDFMIGPATTFQVEDESVDDKTISIDVVTRTPGARLFEEVFLKRVYNF